MVQGNSARIGLRARLPLPHTQASFLFGGGDGAMNDSSVIRLLLLSSIWGASFLFLFGAPLVLSGTGLATGFSPTSLLATWRLRHVQW
ncbi:MAG: hypothetical protein AW07_01095 [Candidatus Accumulibacter sp. SK-11]|nr:MAG: hypothetical protein AW07_01095 [Candidatus Accumulibacter sp. SK-11]HAY26303.1 hypothetical protein [Accumulibacter sp.]